MLTTNTRCILDFSYTILQYIENWPQFRLRLFFNTIFHTIIQYSGFFRGNLWILAVSFFYCSYWFLTHDRKVINNYLSIYWKLVASSSLYIEFWYSYFSIFSDHEKKMCQFPIFSTIFQYSHLYITKAQYKLIIGSAISQYIDY